jgi:hypothetical protein
VAGKPPTDFSKLLDRKDLDVNIQVKTTEDEQEKSLRLHKDRWGFYAKEVSVWILAPVFITGAWLFCVGIITGNGWSPVEKERAWIAFMSITTGAVGVFFGKQLAK